MAINVTGRFNTGAQNYLTEEETPENNVGTVESILSGIASGLIKIPEGVVSLGAELYDLGADTNTSAKVEQWFDDINIFDEAAEATTAGKITETLVNIGVPGGVAFTKGASLANKAIKAKKAKRYFSTNRKDLDYQSLRNLREQATTLNKKDKLTKYAVGAFVGGAAEGAFVADVQKVGTISDMLQGGAFDYLALERGDEKDPARDLINRVKFGTEGALFTGLIGGMGSTIKKLAGRADSLLRSNSRIDQILGRIAAGFRASGKTTQEYFEAMRRQTGKKSRDLYEAQMISRDLDKNIDAIFPFWKNVLNQTATGEQRRKAYSFINDALFSKGDIKFGVDGTVTFGKMDKDKLSNLAKFLLENNANKKNIDGIIAPLNEIRSEWGRMFSLLGKKLEAKDFESFKNEFAEKFQGYLDTSYDIFKNDSLIPLVNYKPSNEVIERAIKAFQAEAKKTGRILSREQALSDINAIVRTGEDGTKLPDKFREFFLKDNKRPDPIFKLPDYFAGKTMADSFSQDVSKSGYVSLGATIDPKKKALFSQLLGKDVEVVGNQLKNYSNPMMAILAGTQRLSGHLRGNQFYDFLYDANEKAKKAGKPGLFFKSKGEADRAVGAANVVRLVGMDPSGKYQIGVNKLLDEYKYVDRITFEAMTEGAEIAEKGLMRQIYNHLFLYPKATSQIAKTILSPLTHVRNFVSAAAFAGANGIIPGVTVSPKEFADNFTNTFKILKGTDAEKLYGKLLEKGVVNSSVSLGDLQGLLRDIDFGKNFSGVKGLKGMMKTLSKIKRVSEDLYTKEDDFWKITTFATEQNRLTKAYKNAGVKKTADEIFDEAADIVRNNVPNYDYVFQFAKDTRRAPIGNFVSFPAEILRTGPNIVRRAIKEITTKVENEKGELVAPLRRVGLARLFGFNATVVGLPYGIQETFQTLQDVSDEEMESLKRFVAPWSKNSVLIPIKDEKTGKLKYIDFSHTNAYDTLTRPVQTVINAVAEGRDDENGIMDDFMLGLVEATKELGQPFISESLWTEALLDILARNGVTKQGKVLYTEETPQGERMYNMLKHLVGTQLPGSLAAFERLDIAIKPVDVIRRGPGADINDYGQSYDVGSEVAGLFGFRAVDVDPERTIDFKIADFQERVRNSRKLFTAPLLKGGVVQPEEIVDRYVAANKGLYSGYNELLRDYNASLILGANQTNINKAFVTRGVTRDLGAIRNGNFRPLLISEGIIRAFQENADQIGMINPYLQASDYINQIYSLYAGMPLLMSGLPEIPNIFREANKTYPGNTYQKYMESNVPGVSPTIVGPASNLNTTQKTQQEGQRVFGPFDRIFGG